MKLFGLNKFVFSLLILMGLTVVVPNNLDAGDWQIHTFGGGELITNVLNMVKLIIYGNSKTDLGAVFSGLVKIVFTLGSFSAVILLLLKQNPFFFFKNFLLPYFFILNVLLLPRTDVTVYDDAVRNSSTTQLSSVSVVKGVPFVFGVFISLLSELSYNFTQFLEQCSHQVNDKIYNWTGRIYAGEYALRLKNDYLFSKDLEGNFREYCKACVWNDLERGLYTRQELVNSPNLLQFLKERTSNLNTVAYQSIGEEGGNTKEFLTCREAINKMFDQFQNTGILKGPMDFVDKWLPTSSSSLNQQAKNIVDSQMNPQETDLNFLLGRSQNNTLNNIRAQSGIIKMLKEELPGTQTSFAARRAEAQNREGMKTTGAIAASNLITMKNVFEALIYFSFPLICLFALIPLMHKLILSWMKACIWIATLAPFYVIINAILNIIWHKKKALMFGVNTNLTLYTHDGLLDLYDSMEAVAALAIGSIFTISLILSRAGFAGLSHALPSMFASGQSAAQSAAAEKITGNYSYSNVSLGNGSAYNYDAFRQNYSGSFNQGGVSMNDASQGMTYDMANDQMYVQQENSRLRDSISSTEGFNHSVQTQLGSSETSIQEEGVNYSEALSESSNQAVGMMEAYSSGSQHGENFSISEMSSEQQTFQKMDSMARDYSQANNVSYDQAVRDMIEMSAGAKLFVGAGVSTSLQDGASESKGTGIGDKYSEGESFSDLLQQASQYSSAEVGSFMQSSDLKKHEDFSNSWNQTNSSAEHLRAAYTKQESLSQLEGDLHSENVSVHQNLDNQFVGHLREKMDGDMGQVNHVLNLPANHPEKKQHIDEFVSSYKSVPVSGADLERSYDLYKAPVDLKSKNIQHMEGTDIQEDVLESLSRGSQNIQRETGDLKNHKFDLQGTEEGERLKEEGLIFKNNVNEQNKMPESDRLSGMQEIKRYVNFETLNKKVIQPSCQKLASIMTNYKHSLAARPPINKFTPQGRFSHQGFMIHNYNNQDQD